MPLPMTIEIQGDRICLQREQWKNNVAYISNYPGLLDEVKNTPGHIQRANTPI